MSPAEVETVAKLYRSAVVRWAESYVAAAEVEDLVQDTFRLLTEKASDVEPAKAAAWLRTTVWRLAREHRPDRRLAVVEQLPEVASPELNPEDTLQSLQLREWEQAALNQIAESRRTILQRVANGETLAEVARAEDEPESTVRKRADVAVAQVRGILQREAAAERRRSGGFSSWSFVLAILDLLRRWREVSRKMTARTAVLPTVAALGATVLGGALQTFFTAPVERPLPAGEPAEVAEVVLAPDPPPVY